MSVAESVVTLLFSVFQCKVEGCPYVAAPRLVQIHYDFVSFFNLQCLIEGLYLKFVVDFFLARFCWLLR